MSDVLILIGSPRSAAKATSRSLGSYLQNRLCQKGLEVEALQLIRYVSSPVSLKELMKAVEDAETVVFISPLYVDGLPAPVVKTLEVVRDRLPVVPGRQLVAISNCGFPEAHHNDTALEIYETFARQCRFTWRGGLSLGMGPVISGQPLDKMRHITRRVRAALDLTATAIAQKQQIPKEAVELMARSMIPSRLYLWLGNRGWKRSAKRYGVHRELRRRPYSQ